MRVAKLFLVFQTFADSQEDWSASVLYRLRQAKFYSYADNLENAQQVIDTVPEILSSISSVEEQQDYKIRWQIRAGKIFWLQGQIENRSKTFD